MLPSPRSVGTVNAVRNQEQMAGLHSVKRLISALKICGRGLAPPLTVCLFEGFGEYRCEGPLVSGKKLDAVRQKPLAAIC